MTVADVVAKYKELSKSYIDPYVVRDHAFTYDQLSKTDYYRYIDDSADIKTRTLSDYLFCHPVDPATWGTPAIVETTYLPRFTVRMQ